MAKKMKAERARKGRAQWGNRPPGYHPQEQFNGDQILILAGLCDLPDEAPRLKELLSEKSDALQMTKYFFEIEIPIKDQRATLGVLTKRARELHTRIGDADLSTRRWIFSNYRDWRLTKHEPDDPVDSLQLFERDVDHLGALALSMENALKFLPRNDGAKPLSALHDTCRILVRVYETFTGENFRFQPSHKAENGKREFITPATRFVSAAATILYPDSTPANLDWSLRNAKKTP